MEEHLVTTHVLFDKLSSANVPIRIVRSDLSTAFERVYWPAPWLALPEQGLHDFDDPKSPPRPRGASCWQQWLQQVFCHTRWSTTKILFSAPGCFARCWKCRWRIGVMKCSIWVWICVMEADHCWTCGLQKTF